MSEKNKKSEQERIREIQEEKRSSNNIRDKESAKGRSRFSLQFKETDDNGPTTFNSDEKNK